MKLALRSANDVLAETQDQLQNTNAKTKSLYGDLHIQRCKFQRTAVEKKDLQDHIKLLESVELHTAKGDAAHAIHLLGTSCAENATLKNQLSVLLKNLLMRLHMPKLLRWSFEQSFMKQGNRNPLCRSSVTGCLR
jgi:hypothetical protein